MKKLLFSILMMCMFMLSFTAQAIDSYRSLADNTTVGVLGGGSIGGKPTLV